VNTGHRLFLDEDLERIDVIAEADHTQLGPGNPELSGITLPARNLVLGRLKLQPLFLGHTVLTPGLALLYVPLGWKGEYRFNGTTFGENSVGLVTGTEGYFTRGEEADAAGIVVSLEALHRDLSSLAGVTQDELQLPDGQLTLSAPVIKRLRSVLAMYSSADGTELPPYWAESLHEGVLEVLMTASFVELPRSRDERNEIIVRRAEEYFMAVLPNQPLLVDLCRAAGVGKNTLYRAFHSLFGISPIDYFRKRRFSSARRDLIRSQASRGVVKRVAINHGFTELGRFSTEYRQLFGERPSRTLIRSKMEYQE
jgi:AraC-like DNA-binding protein